MPAFLDRNDDNPFELGRGLGQDFSQPFYNARGRGIAQAEHDHTRRRCSGEGDDLPEIQIERQDNALFRRSPDEDLRIGELLESLLPRMRGVIPLGPQPFDDPSGNTDVREGPRSAGLRGVNGFLRKPGRVLQHLLDVAGLQV